MGKDAEYINFPYHSESIFKNSNIIHFGDNRDKIIEYYHKKKNEWSQSYEQL